MDVREDMLDAVNMYARHDMHGLTHALDTMVIKGGKERRARKKAIATRSSASDAISFAGCKDSQTSADTVEDGKAAGAMSYVRCIFFL